MRGKNTLVKPQGLLRAQMRTICLPGSTLSIHSFGKYLLSTDYVLGTVLHILGNIFQGIFQIPLLRKAVESRPLSSAWVLIWAAARACSSPSVLSQAHRCIPAVYAVSQPSASQGVT